MFTRATRISDFKLTRSALGIAFLIAIFQAVRGHQGELHYGWQVISSSQQPFLEEDAANLLYGGHVWHAKSPPHYPEWVKITVDQPRKINHLMIRAQPGSSVEFKRAPRNFIFQGSNDDMKWSDLLVVKDSIFTHPGERKHWSVNNRATFRYYRIYITANNGDADSLTIWQIKLE